MAEIRPSNTPPSESDGAGVRIVRKAGRGSRGAWLWIGAVAVVALFVWWMLEPNASHATVAETNNNGAHRELDGLARTSQPVVTTSIEEPQPLRNDPNDLASHFQPGDPEPTGAEVIEALHGAGIHSGLGAFNPPGTSPPLEGLAVPDGFSLPPGYVRHYQVTDEGVPIEPILMFSPDFTPYDAQGRPIAIPANRVVPQELAPPGMPLRRVRVH
ncbi:hypothetical protein [Lysobacter tyrosinilyticus]